MNISHGPRILLCAVNAMVVLTIASWVWADPTPQQPDAGSPDAGSTQNGEHSQRGEQTSAPLPLGSVAWLRPREAERIVPGRDLALPISRSEFAKSGLQRAILKRGKDLPCGEEAGGAIDVPVYHQEKDGDTFVVVRAPVALALERDPHEYRWNSQEATLCFCKNDKDKPCDQALPSIRIEVPNIRWGFAWAIGAVVFWFLIANLLAYFVNKRNESITPSHVVRLLGGFSVDPSNRYNLGVLQALIWSYAVVFGLVLVWKVTERVVDIPTQMVALLGIGGGTAIATLYQNRSRWSDIPQKFKDLLQEGNKPHLDDLISDAGRPSILKLQSLMFTVIAVVIVIKELAEKYAFPALSDGLIGLMGVSSALLIGSQPARPESIDALKARMTSLAARMEASENSGTSIRTRADVEKLADMELRSEIEQVLTSINKYVG